MADQAVSQEASPEVPVVSKVRSGKKEFVGIVKSDKMSKTIVVAVETKTLHPLYKKYVNRTKKIKAHDETNDAKIGDRVRVVECRPISKEKCWKLAAVLERAR
ncbi:30S ribosomal protein S17 [Treponema primitia ZAS-2]|uniref:Small ribosomal subunit protein uS17 n=1 Tax=Treponema primitia (strain ATCC BAA-887 / DSM 12427 / ZAS-2) TaxID=545694 RepID=F5YQ16_TREPZ|nr:30S ribosomal protein S17 [Treponema primitia]AEF84498.1 30S ribosomal protein S17 [Treponema primitia ZAS-2]